MATDDERVNVPSAEWNCVPYIGDHTHTRTHTHTQFSLIGSPSLILHVSVVQDHQKEIYIMQIPIWTVGRSTMNKLSMRN